MILMFRREKNELLFRSAERGKHAAGVRIQDKRGDLFALQGFDKFSDILVLLVSGFNGDDVGIGRLSSFNKKICKNVQ